MTLTTPTRDRRRSDRRRACFGGTLRIAALLPEVECRLRDHSLTGVRIVVAEDVPLPRVVDLTVTCRNETRRAEIVWRSGTQAGLAFLDTPASATPPPAGACTQAVAAWRRAVAPDRLN